MNNNCFTFLNEPGQKIRKLEALSEELPYDDFYDTVEGMPFLEKKGLTSSLRNGGKWSAHKAHSAYQTPVEK